MTAWLDPIIRAIDTRALPLTVFFRDDDAGWADERLFALLDVFERREMPIDLAVIPEATSEITAARLGRRARRAGLVGLHQHGFAHANHERVGRSCEFGASRPAHSQRADIRRGRERLLRMFGERLDPIFTPPWNRCTQTTAECLVELGFRALSRDLSADRLDVHGLVECPIASDWLKKRQGVRVSRLEWAESFAALAARATTPVGVMLHHAVMDEEECGAIALLLDVFRRSPRVRAVGMAEAAGIGAALAGRRFA